MVWALIVVVALFGLLFAGRLAAARRYLLMQRWPALVFAGAALFALARAHFFLALALGALSFLAWVYWPRWSRRPPPAGADPEDVAARRLLGVADNATAAEIRAAYRLKMAQAHPDRGGSPEHAARLSAARDRLLRRRR